MPLEGHWERQNTPLRRLSGRESRLAWIVGVLVVLSVAIGTFFVLTASSESVPAGCVKIESGSTMGGGIIRPCGAAATRTCRTFAARTDPGAQPAKDACRKAGIK